MSVVLAASGSEGLREVAEHGFASPLPHAFRVEARSHGLGDVEVLQMQARAFTYRNDVRGPLSGRRIACMFLREGEFDVQTPRGSSRARTELAGRGSAVIVPLWRPFGVRCVRSARWSSVFLDADAVEPMLPNLPDRPVIIGEQGGLATAAGAFGDAIGARARPFREVERYAARQLLLEMCGSLLLDAMGLGERRSVAGGVRDRALAVIGQRHTEAALSTAELAAAVRVAPRSLQAAFTASGTSVWSEVRRARARTAAALLSDPGFDGLSCAAVAEQSGFGSPLSMRRALEEFGHPGPRQLRRRVDAG